MDNGLRIDVPLVRRLVASQFPHWAKLPVRPVSSSGWDNRTFHLGPRMVVRLPSAQAYAPQVLKEQEWLPRIGPELPLAVPRPIALGEPDRAFPWPWSIYEWLDGEPAATAEIGDHDRFGRDLGRFLAALHRVDPSGGPPPGEHNFFRGGSPLTYDGETRRAIASLGDRIDETAATAIWEAAIRTEWQAQPVWLHGDMAPGNLLVRGGRLVAVIDFGTCAVGDPACDLAIWWTFLGERARAAFREALSLDEATWLRARGWAIWKALIVAAELPGTDPSAREASRSVLERILAEPRS